MKYITTLSIAILVLASCAKMNISSGNESAYLTSKELNTFLESAKGKVVNWNGSILSKGIDPSEITDGNDYNYAPSGLLVSYINPFLGQCLKAKVVIEDNKICHNFTNDEGSPEKWHNKECYYLEEDGENYIATQDIFPDEKIKITITDQVASLCTFHAFPEPAIVQ